MNSSKIFLTILLIITVCVCSCKQLQQKKEKSVNQKLELRGIRLGMSFEELKSKYPKFTDTTSSLGSLGISSKFGETAIKLDLKDVPELKGLEQVNVTLLDEKVYDVAFKYNEKFSESSADELTKQFEESLGLKNMSCEQRWTSKSIRTFASRIWQIEERTYDSYEISTFCEPYLIKIITEERYNLLKLEDEAQSSVRAQREHEINNMDEINKAKAKPTPKTFQP
jgi:hypothetical protein